MLQNCSCSHGGGKDLAHGGLSPMFAVCACAWAVSSIYWPSGALHFSRGCGSVLQRGCSSCQHSTAHIAGLLEELASRAFILLCMPTHIDLGDAVNNQDELVPGGSTDACGLNGCGCFIQWRRGHRVLCDSAFCWEWATPVSEHF